MNKLSVIRPLWPHALVNEVTDLHGRIYRTRVSIQREGYDLFDIHLTSTFSGSERPDQGRTLWRASLDEEALLILKATIDQALATSRSVFPPEPISKPYCAVD